MNTKQKLLAELACFELVEAKLAEIVRHVNSDDELDERLIARNALDALCAIENYTNAHLFTRE